MDELEKETIHRLEAFSDIVIGFSLAQLGATGIFKDETLHAGSLFTFLASFAIVCSLWYFHHRLFQSFFVPRALPIVLNFIWLAVVVLLVFASINASSGGFAHRIPTLRYFGLYALAYGILSVQTALGVFLRKNIEPVLKSKAQANIVILTFWTAIFVACYTEVQLEPWTPAIGNAISWTFIIGAIGSTILSFYFRRRKMMIANA